MSVPFTIGHVIGVLTMLGWVSKAAVNLDAQGEGACVTTGSRRRLWGDRRGNVAMIVAVTAIPVVIAVGAGIDLSRMAKARATLQNAVDAAALAGSTLNTAAGQGTVAQNSAQSYFDKYVLGGDLTVASSNVTVVQPSSATTSSPSVTVSATATLPRTFGIGTVTVTATAVAANGTSSTASTTQVTPTSQPLGPIGTPSQVLSYSGSKSTAADWNSIYMYGVPIGSNGKPDYTSYPPVTQFYEIGSNCNQKIDANWTSNSMCNNQYGTTAPTVTSYKYITADQPIAFMFVNMNNGMYPSPNGVGGYGANQYGAQPGWWELMTTATLALGQSPSQITDSSVSVVKGLLGVTLNQGATHYSDANNATLSNCALQIVLVTDINNPPTNPPYPGQCLAATDPRSGYQYANLSCRQINGRTFMYWWNDMGAKVDDKDYKNLVYTVTCLPGTSNPDGGTLSTNSPVQGQSIATPAGQSVTNTPRLIQ